jgi:hypothetical protein
LLRSQSEDIRASPSTSHFLEADLNEAARRRTLTREAIGAIYG